MTPATFRSMIAAARGRPSPKTSSHPRQRGNFSQSMASGAGMLNGGRLWESSHASTHLTTERREDLTDATAGFTRRLGCARHTRYGGWFRPRRGGRGRHCQNALKPSSSSPPGWYLNYALSCISSQPASRNPQPLQALFLAQRFARHASPPTTVIYTHPADEELAEGVRDLPC